MILSAYAQKIRSSIYSVRPVVSAVLYTEVDKVVKDLQARSPVDSGMFRNRWIISRVASSGTAIYALAIRNSLDYARYIDEGAEVGGPPWFFGSLGSSEGQQSRSGKLIIYNQRVWAGGKSPAGHVIGGVSSVVLNRQRVRQIALAISDSLVQLI